MYRELHLLFFLLRFFFASLFHDLTDLADVGKQVASDEVKRDARRVGERGI